MKQSDRLRLLAEQLDFADKIQHLIKTGQISRIEAEVKRLKDFAADLLIPKPDFPAGGFVTEAGPETLFNKARLQVSEETRERIRRYTDAIDAKASPGEILEAGMEVLSRVRRDAEAVPQLVAALRDLHDLQNGPPLERYADEYNEIMGRVAELLEKYKTE